MPTGVVKVLVGGGWMGSAGDAYDALAESVIGLSKQN
jgi:hypothetical protein